MSLFDSEIEYDNTVSGPCPICDEMLYNKTIYHICAERCDGTIETRLDLFECPICDFPTYYENGVRIDLSEFEMFCRCDDE